MAAPPWIKLWLEARTDRKLDRLTDAQHRIWFNLLLYAAEQDHRGTFTDKGALAIEVARGRQKNLDATIAVLLDLGIIEDLGDRVYAFHAFEERQSRKPSDSPEAVRERVRKHREKLATEAAQSTGVVESTGVVTELSLVGAEPCNARKRPVTRDCNEEVEGEGEGEQTDQTPLSSRSSEPERKERGSYPQAEDPAHTIAYAEGKLGRALTHDEKRSVKRWVREYGSVTTGSAIGEFVPERGMDLAYIGSCIANWSKPKEGVAMKSAQVAS